MNEMIVVQVRVAEEVAVLTEGAAIIEWLADYAVLREQARENERLRREIRSPSGLVCGNKI
jgi:hypothetical protein